MGGSCGGDLDRVHYDLAFHAQKEIVRLQSGLRMRFGQKLVFQFFFKRHSAKSWKDHQRQNGGGKDAADDDGSQRTLNFGSSASGDGHGEEAERGDQRGH